MIRLRNIRRNIYKIFTQPVYAVEVLKKRAMAQAYYFLGKGKSSYPEAVTFFLTHKCNLHCKMCGQWGESGVTKKMQTSEIMQELDIEKLKKTIDNISQFKPNITLFGGEPLLYSKIIELIRHIKSKGLHLLAITNGSLLNDLASDLVDSGIDEINISLDGDEKLHDEIRGMPGLFKTITSGIEKVNKIKEEKELKKPLINLQCTITKYNYKHLTKMIKVADELNASSLTFHNLIFLDKELIEKQKVFDVSLECSSREWEGFIVDPGIDVESLYKTIQEIKSKRYKFSIDFYPNFSKKGIGEYYNDPKYMPSEYKARCLSPWICGYVFPDGELRPCLNCNYSFGNINEEQFVDIWNSAKARLYRNTLKNNKLFPVCVRCTEFYRY